MRDETRERESVAKPKEEGRRRRAIGQLPRSSSSSGIYSFLGLVEALSVVCGRSQYDSSLRSPSPRSS